MAPLRGTNARLLIDEFDFSGVMNSIDIELSTKVLDPTNFSSAGVEKFPGLPDGKIEHNGFHTGAGAGGIFEELRTRLGGSGAAYVAALMGSAGNPAFVLPTTWAQQLKLAAPVNDLITLNGLWPAARNLRPGLLLYTGIISGTGTQASIDFGAAGSAGGVAYLFVQSITGSATNATVKVQSSATEGGAYADEGTFTFSAVGALALAMSGTVSRWLRINTTALGGATNFTVACIAGIAGVSF